MNNSKLVTGNCLCGTVTVEFSLKKETFGSCHCGMCRKWSGGPTLVVEAEDNVKFKGEEFITVYNSSDWAERAFCKCCGTHLFYRLKAGGFMNFSMDILQGVDHLKFDLQVFIDKKPSNYSFSNQTQQMTEAEVFAAFASK